MSDKAVSLPLAQIKNKFDVRLALDQDRVIQFAGMYESGVDLPPIEVVETAEDEYAFIDGRHRAAARDYLNLTNVMAIIRNGGLIDDPGALFARALQANWGGSKPPTRDDIQHTILRMLESGLSRNAIEKILVFIPRSSLRAYTAGAMNRLSRRKIALALDAISDGATIENAAKRVALPVERLKDVVSGKKGIWGKGRSQETQTCVELKTYISQHLFSANTGIAKKIQMLLASVDDGEISSNGAAGVLKAWKDHLRKSVSRVDDWEQRLAGIARFQSSAAPNSVPEPQEAVAPKAKPKKDKPARPKVRPAKNPLDYKGVRMPPGFWQEELPKAIRATGYKSAAPLVEYFSKRGKAFTLKQVDCALQRWRLRGMPA